MSAECCWRQPLQANARCMPGKIGEADTNVGTKSMASMRDNQDRAFDFGDVVSGMYIEAVNLDGIHGLYIIEGVTLTHQ